MKRHVADPHESLLEGEVMIELVSLTDSELTAFSLTGS